MRVRELWRGNWLQLAVVIIGFVTEHAYSTHYFPCICVCMRGKAHKYTQRMCLTVWRRAFKCQTAGFEMYVENFPFFLCLLTLFSSSMCFVNICNYSPLLMRRRRLQPKYPKQSWVNMYTNGNPWAKQNKRVNKTTVCCFLFSVF